MRTLRPRKQFNFVGMWKKGFIFSGTLIALAIVGLIASFITTGSPLTLGTEFSGGTSITINNTGEITEDQVSEAFSKAASDLSLDTQMSSIQTASDTNGNPGFIVKTTDTDSTVSNRIMTNVEEQLGIDAGNVQIETIGASWGASVIMSSFIALLLSFLAILIVISVRYREPRMGVVALITLIHDIIIIIGIYAWAGMFFHMEITSDVIAALLAIIGYSLYDTIVVFHRINRNASPQMKYSLKTCANKSLNEIIVRSLNTSITSAMPVLVMLILGTDTLLNFAFAMFCGILIGVYSTLAISAPVYTLWKGRQPEYARLEKKYEYRVIESTFTKEMLIEARAEHKKAQKEAKQEEKAKKLESKKADKEQKSKANEAEKDFKATESAKDEESKAVEDEMATDAPADEVVQEETANEDVAEAAFEAHEASESEDKKE